MPKHITADILQRGLSKMKSYKKLLTKLSHKPNKQIDSAFEKAHNDTFKTLDCLTCANCCKTTSPYFLQQDIMRLAKHLKMKPSAFIDTYLMVDEDGDYVFQTAPCPFLGTDNYCSVYEARPKACAEYPHTNRKNMTGIFELTLKNAEICPAVQQVFEKIERDMG